MKDLFPCLVRLSMWKQGGSLMVLKWNSCPLGKKRGKQDPLLNRPVPSQWIPLPPSPPPPVNKIVIKKKAQKKKLKRKKGEWCL
jgi:hypothetical protein